MERVLKLEGVGFRYDRLWALRGVDLEVCAGELVGILGPNGSGKSTLLKVADGICIPQKGKVLLGGRPLSGRGRRDVARQVAMVAQENHFRFSFSVMEVVLMGRFAHLGRFHFERPGDVRVAWEALEATRSSELASRSIHELSGGEKQRVLIARALAQEPRVVLLDEPTSFLDLRFKKEIFELVSSLARHKALGVVVVSHDIDLSANYCDRILLLREGRVFAEGPPADVITPENVEAVYECPVVVDSNPATGAPRVSVL